MRAVRRLVTYRLAAGWPGLVALVLLVGLAGAAVLTAVAGARRTASAYPRFLVASRASDVLAGPAGPGLRGYGDGLDRPARRGGDRADGRAKRTLTRSAVAPRVPSGLARASTLVRGRPWDTGSII